MTDRDGRRREYQYDAEGRVLMETWKDAGGAVVDVRSFGYDPATGNLTSASNSNGAYSFIYRPDNRVQTETAPFGVSLSFGYNSVGDRTSVTDSFGGTETSVYDADHRLTRRAYQNGSTQLRIDLSYNDTVNNMDGSLNTMTRYADLGGTQVVGTTQDGYLCKRQREVAKKIAVVIAEAQLALAA